MSSLPVRKCRSVPANVLRHSVQISPKKTEKTEEEMKTGGHPVAHQAEELISTKLRWNKEEHATEVQDEDLETEEQKSEPPNAAGETTQAAELLAIQKSNEERKEEDAGDEDLKAPLDLLVQFLSALMDEDYQLASKLCQMILIFEPENPEAAEFLQLIQRKLVLEEQEEQQSREENDDEDDEEDDGVTSERDESSSLSSSSSSSSCSSSSSDNDGDDEDEDDDPIPVKRQLNKSMLF